MRILFCGDVVGRSGRDAIASHLPRLREELKLEFVIVNGENAAHGFGITEQICETLFQAGADCITGGNHSWDKPEIAPYMDSDRRMLRPINYPDGTPGRGVADFVTGRGAKVMVINVMCRLFMELLDDPFKAVERELPMAAPKPGGYAAVIIDVHGEATSEKMAMGHLADGKASLVVGTHTHVPTGDAHILEYGTGYQTDAGMCGDYNSVIGMEKGAALQRFRRRFPSPRLTPAEGKATLCGTFLETDDATGLARRISPVRVGGRLQEQLPSFDD
jgi:metallophosphoesterase (TIGR00282 family)